MKLLFCALLLLPFAGPARGQAAASGAEEAMELIANNRPENAAGGGSGGKIRSFDFTEGEGNGFIRRLIQRDSGKASDGTITLRSAVVRLKDGRRAEAAAVVAFDAGALKLLGMERNSLLGRILRRCAGGDSSVELECLISSAKGSVFVRVLRLKLKGVQLPDAAVRTLLKLAGKKQNPPVDFDRPFPLQNGIEKIEVLPGRLRLEVKIF